MKTPSGYKVKILNAKGENITKADLILEEDFSLQISNTYDSLISSKGNTVMSAISNLFQVASNAGFSGQIKQQGFQVWTETKPLELKLALSLYFRKSGKTDVYEPALDIIKYSVPIEADNGYGLIPPGPNILDILNLKPEDAGEVGTKIFKKSEGSLTFDIGGIIIIPDVIIRNAIPTWSAQKDSDGYPMKCKLDIDASTVNIVTRQMLDKLNNPDQTIKTGEYN